MAITAFGATLTDPHRGLPRNSADIVFPELPSTLLATVAITAGGLGTVVIYTSGRREHKKSKPAIRRRRPSYQATSYEPSIP
jgi:hypothetical protein